MSKLGYLLLGVALGSLGTNAVYGIAQAAEPPKEFNLRLTQQDVSYIAGLLQAQPFKDVYDILNRMQAQLNEQTKPAVEAPPKEDIPK